MKHEIRTHVYGPNPNGPSANWIVCLRCSCGLALEQRTVSEAQVNSIESSMRAIHERETAVGPIR